MINWIIENIVPISTVICLAFICFKLDQWHNRRQEKRIVDSIMKCIKECGTIKKVEDE